MTTMIGLALKVDLVGQLHQYQLKNLTTFWLGNAWLSFAREQIYRFICKLSVKSPTYFFTLNILCKEIVCQLKQFEAKLYLTNKVHK